MHSIIESSCKKCNKKFLQTHRAIKYCSDKCYLKDYMYLSPKTKCWIWAGAFGIRGYGKITKKGESIGAHRLSYLTFKGNIPNNLFVLHKCDNRACINPRHLFLGTHTDNVRDMHSKGRATTIGVLHHDNKLTVKNVMDIRKDKRLMRVIAKEYGISTATVSAIRHRQKWKHIPEETTYERTVGRAGLTKNQILKIKNDPRQQKEIAKDYGLTQAHISKIKLGLVYRAFLENIPFLTHTIL